MEIILIAAMTTDRVIGHNNTIPWHIPGEQTRFKEVTMGHSLIMGRKTWQSIGHPLPGRQNIVLTGNREFQAPGCQVVYSLEQGLESARKNSAKKVFIIGGEQIYRLALERADSLLLTIIDREYPGDTFFPEFSCPPFALTDSQQVLQPVPYTVQTFLKKIKS
jgi:dihydrofolate reductase